MHNRVHFVLHENPLHKFRVGDVPFDKPPPLHEVAVPVNKIVQDKGFIPPLGQGAIGVGADVARAAGDENSLLAHGMQLLWMVAKREHHVPINTGY